MRFLNSIDLLGIDVCFLNGILKRYWEAWIVLFLPFSEVLQGHLSLSSVLRKDRISGSKLPWCPTLLRDSSTLHVTHHWSLNFKVCHWSGYPSESWHLSQLIRKPTFYHENRTSTSPKVPRQLVTKGTRILVTELGLICVITLTIEGTRT